MHHQAHGYFGLLSIGNEVNTVLPNPLIVSALQNLANNPQDIKLFYNRVHSDMIDRELEGSIKKSLLIKLGFIEGNINRMKMGPHKE